MQSQLTRLSALAFVLCQLVPGRAAAQLANQNAFLQGNYVEVGTSHNGSFGTSENSPAGYQPSRAFGGFYNPFTGTTSGAGALGFVADPAKDGWAIGTPDYIGDYFLPGYPQEGWEVVANGTAVRGYSTDQNMFTGTGAGFDGPGAALITSSGCVSHSVVGSKVSAVWQGTYLSNLEMTQTVTLDTGRVYFLIRMKMKNSGTTTINDVFYMRTVDPDNEAATPGSFSFTTANTIVSQNPSPTNKALVSAVGPTYPTLSYLGLGALDCRAKVFYQTSGLEPTDEADDIFDSTSGGGTIPGYVGTQGSSFSSDVGIGIIFNLGDIAPGDSVDFAYAYVLKESELDSAFNDLTPSIALNGIPYLNGDTLYTCDTGSFVLNIVNGSGYSWDWSPATGLSSTTGLSNTVTLTGAPITYTITGIASSAASCSSDTQVFSITLDPKVVPPPTVISPLGFCLNSAAVPLTATGTSLLWYTSATGGVGTATAPTPTTDAIGTQTYYVTQTLGRCESPRAAIVVEVNTPIESAISINRSPLCTGDSAILSFSGDRNTSANFNWTFDDGIVANDDDGLGESADETVIWNTEGQKLITLTVDVAGCLAEDSFFVTVYGSPLAEIQTPESTTLCIGDTLKLQAEDAGIGAIYRWQPYEWQVKNNYVNNTRRPEFIVPRSGRVVLNVLSPEGCMASDSIGIIAESCCQAFVPNAFSPNGDGRNESFRLGGASRFRRLIDMRVVNRWGQVMFQTKDGAKGWDGTLNGVPQDMGTYFYTITYECPDGSQSETSGDFVLIR